MLSLIGLLVVCCWLSRSEDEQARASPPKKSLIGPWNRATAEDG